MSTGYYRIESGFKATFLPGENYPWGCMRVGDSFLVELNDGRNPYPVAFGAVRSASAFFHATFRLVSKNSFRVWRVEWPGAIPDKHNLEPNTSLYDVEKNIPIPPAKLAPEKPEKPPRVPGAPKPTRDEKFAGTEGILDGYEFPWDQLEVGHSLIAECPDQDRPKLAYWIIKRHDPRYPVVVKFAPGGVRCIRVPFSENPLVVRRSPEPIDVELD